MPCRHVVDDGHRLVDPADVAQARRELQLRAVPVRLAQPGRQGLLVERHRGLLVAGAVVGPRQLVGDPGVAGVSGVETLGDREPRDGIRDLPQRGDLVLRLVLAASHHDLAADRVGVVGGRAAAVQPVDDLDPLGVAHHRHHVTVVGGLDQGLQPGQLGGVRRDVADARTGQPEPQLALEVVRGAPAQVVGLVGGDDVVGPQPGDLAEGLEDVVGAVAGRAERQVHPPAGGDEAPGDVEQCLEAGLVVGEVDDDGDLTGVDRQGVGVHPARVEHVVGDGRCATPRRRPRGRCRGPAPRPPPPGR